MPHTGLGLIRKLEEPYFLLIYKVQSPKGQEKNFQRISCTQRRGEVENERVKTALVPV